jgi:hypothetical protein
MNIEDIKEYYGFLGHSHETEVRVIKLNHVGSVPSIFCKNEQDFVNACQKYNSEYQIYAGINERTPGGKNDDDVKFITNVGHDVDCHQDNSSLEVAERVCFKYRDDVVRAGLEEPMIIFSGSGYWILHHVEPIENNPENRQKIKMFGAYAKKLYEEDGILFDTKVYNPSRIGRVAGTINLKNRNLSKILNNPKGIPCKKFKHQIDLMQLPNFDGVKMSEIPKGNCAFMNYCLSHKLPEGERHSIISRNLSLYICNRPDRELLRQQYIAVQEMKSNELLGWLNSIDNNTDKNYPFSCGELISYQFRNNIPLQCENCSLFKRRSEDLGDIKGWANSISIVRMAKRHGFENCYICEAPFKFTDSHGLFYCPSCKFGGGLKKFVTLILKNNCQEPSQ